MRGLIIDHQTKYINDIIKLFDECDVINYKDFDSKNAEKYDYVILSGGPTLDETFENIKKEKDWLLETRVPVLGICLGIQILCIAYGEEMKKFPKNRKLNKDFRFIDTDYKMLYNHTYYFDKIPNEFIGEVKNGILVWMKHKTRPILAFQGHPEVTENGEKIRDFFLEKIVTKNKII